MFIYDRSDWPNFIWNINVIAEALASVRFHQGILLGKMSSIGFGLQEEADLQSQTHNIIHSSEIEGEHLNPEAVRSSIARHLGLPLAGQMKIPRSVEGVVEMHLDAVKFCHKPLTLTRLYGWHAALFQSGFSGMHIIKPGIFRKDNEGPMVVVSGGYGREKIHFRAPPAERLEKEIKVFLKWFNDKPSNDYIINAAIAHLWFVTLHPFEDGNGRIARCIADMMLARSDNQKNRYYSMSTQIQHERKKYYEILEATQKGSLDITTWLLWFLQCLERAIIRSDETLKNVLNKAKFWEQHSAKAFNERQIKMLNYLFDGFNGHLTSSKWAKMTKCSQDTASRDIQTLLDQHVLIKGEQGGRSTNYLLKDYPINFIE